jgi:hypothetical protein
MRLLVPLVLLGCVFWVLALVHGDELRDEADALATDVDRAERLLDANPAVRRRAMGYLDAVDRGEARATPEGARAYVEQDGRARRELRRLPEKDKAFLRGLDGRYSRRPVEADPAPLREEEETLLDRSSAWLRSEEGSPVLIGTLLVLAGAALLVAVACVRRLPVSRRRYVADWNRRLSRRDDAGGRA